MKKYFNSRFVLEELMHKMDKSEYLDKQEAETAFRNGLDVAFGLIQERDDNVDLDFDYKNNKVIFTFSDEDYDIENDDSEKIDFEEFKIVLDYESGVELYEDFSEIYEDDLQRYTFYREGIFEKAKEYFEKALEELKKLEVNEDVKEEFQRTLTNAINEAKDFNDYFPNYTIKTEW